MTLIVADRTGRVMYGDTLVVNESHRDSLGNVPKIFEMPDGALMGAAGGTPKCAALLQWGREGRKGLPPADAFDGDDCAEAVVLTAGAQILWYAGVLPDHPMGDVFAIGYGAQAFRSAFLAGASIHRAIEIACEVTRVCGPPITELRLARRRRGPVTERTEP